MQGSDSRDAPMNAPPFRRADDFRSDEIVRHGAYVCIQLPARGAEFDLAEISELPSAYELINEFNSQQGQPPEAIGLLKKVSVQLGDISDRVVLAADAVVHIGSVSGSRIYHFCDDLTRLLGPSCRATTLTGVVRPTRYTGNLMHNLTYAHQVLQQSAGVMPNCFLLPMNKTRAWWDKDWMERHTYFLPRYDDQSVMRSEGHVLVTEPGIDCITRRTYRNAQEPAPEGEYDLLNYFECADRDVPVFHDVCAALRQLSRRSSNSAVVIHTPSARRLSPSQRKLPVVMSRKLQRIGVPSSSPRSTIRSPLGPPAR